MLTCWSCGIEIDPEDEIAETCPNCYILLDERDYHETMSEMAEYVYGEER